MSTNALLNFVLYGIEAASPTIAAVIVLSISRTCKKFGVKYFHSKHLLMAVVLPALIAEEIGWRGYLLHFLYEYMKMPCLVPAIVGVVWCLWHYHYFRLGGMDIPVVFFSQLYC